MGLEVNNNNNRFVHPFRPSPIERLCLELRGHPRNNSKDKYMASKGLGKKGRVNRGKDNKCNSHSSVHRQQDWCMA